MQNRQDSQSLPLQSPQPPVPLSCLPFRRKQMRIMQQVITCISLIGFMTQVMQVSLLYFKYATRTQVEIMSPDTITPHSVALCIRYADIIDKERLERETGLRMRQIESLEDNIDQEDLLTVAQVFEFTPKAEELLSQCFVRPDNWSISIKSGEDCYKTFAVSRFFTLNSMCYKVSETLDRRLSLTSVTQTSVLQHKIFELTLGPKFRSAVLVKPIAFWGDYPFESRDYAPLLPELRDSDEQFKHNVIEVYPSDTFFFRLEPPYDTWCFNDVNQKSCKKDCMIEKFAQFDRVPAFELLFEKTVRKVFSVNDMSNDSMLREATAAFNYCHPKCQVTACRWGHTKTSARLTKDKRIDLKIAVLTSTDSDVAIIAQPTMTFIEFFSFVTGCFGTWFGISFLSLDPLKFWKKRKKRRKRRKDCQCMRAPESAGRVSEGRGFRR